MTPGCESPRPGEGFVLVLFLFLGVFFLLRGGGTHFGGVLVMVLGFCFRGCGGMGFGGI